jgi:hypothetical protein
MGHIVLLRLTSTRADIRIRSSTFSLTDRHYLLKPQLSCDSHGSMLRAYCAFGQKSTPKAKPSETVIARDEHRYVQSSCPGNFIIEPLNGKINKLELPRIDVNPRQMTKSS